MVDVVVVAGVVVEGDCCAAKLLNAEGFGAVVVDDEDG